MCTDWFNRINADVACRSIGFSWGCLIDSKDVHSSSATGPACVPLPNVEGVPGLVAVNHTWAAGASIWLDNVDCYGDEEGIHQCMRNEW